jgi:hypothetical protein
MMQHQADKIVESLLGDEEDPKSFIRQNQDAIAKSIVLDKLEELGVRCEDVNGVELYGLYAGDDATYRCEFKSNKATHWGISVHTITSAWLVDWGEYTTPNEAHQQARELHSVLRSIKPRQTIHFIIE